MVTDPLYLYNGLLDRKNLNLVIIVNLGVIVKLFVTLVILISFFNFPLISFSQEIPSFIKEKENVPQNEYVNNNIGLKIRYNDTWALSPYSTSNKECDYCIIVLESKNNNPDVSMSVFAANIRHFSDKCDCKSLVDFMQFQYINKYKPASIVSVIDNQTKISNGISAWHMEYLLSNGNKHYIIWFIVNNVLYEINFEIDKNSYKEFFPEIRAIINSLEFFPPNNTQNIEKQDFSAETRKSSPSILDQIQTSFDKLVNDDLSSTDFSDNGVVEVSIVNGASVLTDTAYQPNPIEIKVGQMVRWTNDDYAFHTVTSSRPGSADSGRDFDSGLAGPSALTTQGKTFEHTFESAGEFDYHCTLHPFMVGKVIVTKPILSNMTMIFPNQ